MALYTVSNNTTILAADINQLVNVLQQPSGGQEIGNYILAMPGYTSSATLSWYVPSLSRGSTPVSVSVDTSTFAAVGMTNATPSTDHLTASGFHIYDFSSGAQTNSRAGGKYTIQY